VLNVTPNGTQGALWSSGGGMAAEKKSIEKTYEYIGEEKVGNKSKINKN